MHTGGYDRSRRAKDGLSYRPLDPADWRPAAAAFQVERCQPGPRRDAVGVGSAAGPLDRTGATAACRRPPYPSRKVSRQPQARSFRALALSFECHSGSRADGTPCALITEGRLVPHRSSRDQQRRCGMALPRHHDRGNELQEAPTNMLLSWCFANSRHCGKFASTPDTDSEAVVTR